MTKNTRPWHSSMFVTTVMTTLDGQDPEAMSNFIYKIQTEYLDDTYETFGSSKYRSKTDDSLISDIKKAKSLLDKFDKIAIFDMQKLLHTRSCDYNLLQLYTGYTICASRAPVYQSNRRRETQHSESVIYGSRGCCPIGLICRPLMSRPNRIVGE